MKLYFESYSQLAKRHTLFIHGNLGSSVWWEPTLAHWRKVGSLGEGSLILADWRGSGRNPDWGANQAFTLPELAQDFVELLQGLDAGPVDVVGHSLGGLIALQLMLLAPERVNRAVLLDPVGAGGVVFDDSMYEAFRQMAASSDLTRAVILSTIKGEERLDEAYKARLSADAFKAVKGIGSSVLEILKTVNLKADATKVNVPTLILHGAHDQIIPLQDSQELVGLMPNAQLEVLADAGHCWNVEDPEQFTARVRQWFGA